MNKEQPTPASWIKKDLCGVAAVIDPHPSHRAPDAVDRGIPFAGIGDLSEDGKLDVEKARIVSADIFEEHSKRYTISSNTIGFGRVATIGKVINFSNPESTFTVSPTLAIIEPNSDQVRDYILYVLQGQYIGKQIDGWLTGSTRSSLGIDLLRKLSIYFPDKKAQTEIAKILSTIDQLIEKTQALIDKHTAIKQGMMADLFTRGIDLETGQLRPPVEQAPHLYKETELGWLPKSWNVVPFFEVADIIDPQPDHRTPPESENGISYIGISDFLPDGTLDLEGSRKVVVRAYNKQRKRFLVDKDDIIFGKIGTIGEPKFLNKKEGFALSANIVLIKPKVESEYILSYLESNIFQAQVKLSTNTTSQPALGIEKIRQFKILKATDDEISRMNLILENIRHKQKTQEKYLAKLNMKKNGLMQDLLTGKVTVGNN